MALCASLGSVFAPAARSQGISLERVVITGSRIPRADAETALPVQVISREEIERSGAFSVEDLLARISANFGGFNEAMGINNADQPGFSGASLRGFGARATLVLLNGRRVANYAFSGEGGIGVDLHAIPMAAIDRIEVLKDGASAVYGSDAIAGVINFVTRRDFRGAEVDVTRAQAQAGGGARERETLTLGAGDTETEGFNVFAVIDHRRQHALAARQRAFAATSYRPELGLDGPTLPSFPANVFVARGVFVNPAAPACTEFTVFQRGGCFYDYVRQSDILPPSDNLSLLTRGALALPDRSEAYSELLWSRQQTRFASSATPVGRFAIPGGKPLVIPEGSPFYPTDLGLTGDIVNPRYRTVPLGPRVTDIGTDQWRALVGWRGAVAGWDIDSALARSTGRSTSDHVSGYVDAVRLGEAFATGLINPFGDSGPQGNALLASTQTHGRSREARGTTDSVDLRASRDIAQWSAGPVTLGVGVEARRERLDDRATELNDRVVGGTFLRPKTGARQAQSLNVELVLPLAPKLDAQLAVRTDRYSDFGTHTSPKLALRWQPQNWLLFRASAGTGFRAPSLPELYSAQTSIALPLQLPDPKRCPVTQLDADCFPEFPVLTGGNPALQPERSRQASIGLVFEPIDGASIGIDWWRLSLRNTIGSLAEDVILSGDDRYEGRNIVRGPVDPAFPNLPGPITQLVQINENGGRRTAAGVDVDLRYRLAAGAAGRFTLELSGSYLAEQRTFNGAIDQQLVGRYRGGPRWQHALTLGWERAGWSATVVQTWRGGYVDANPGVDGAERNVAAYHVWDAQLGYRPAAGWTLAVGVKNLFDRDPPFTNQGDFFQQGYDPSYADPRGRVWYARAGYRWR